MIASMICNCCGRELRHVLAPPDPVYGLPICTCPACGVSIVRRKHRLRTHPVAFRRLDRAFNRMALTLFVILCVSGAAMLISALATRQAELHERAPWPALAHAVRNADKSELFSIGILLTIIALVQLLSGLVLSRLLWHWKTTHLALAWGALLAVLSAATIAVGLKIDGSPVFNRFALGLIGSMLQVAGVCWLLTATGLWVGKATMPSRDAIVARRFRHSLKWARKLQSRSRAG
ncbi:MAG: hypothetical protein Phyf2KO_22280 [Phycisphaerales bacterium]